jgi:deoxyribodipyrimidine photolyase-like uncharacterized protein
VLGDQLDPSGPAFRGHRAGEARVLMVESDYALARLPFNRERRVLVIGAMRRLAQSLRDDGWQVDLRSTATLADGIMAHAAEHRPSRIVVASYTGRKMSQALRTSSVSTNSNSSQAVFPAAAAFNWAS